MTTDDQRSDSGKLIEEIAGWLAAQHNSGSPCPADREYAQKIFTETIQPWSEQQLADERARHARERQDLEDMHQGARIVADQERAAKIEAERVRDIWREKFEAERAGMPTLEEAIRERDEALAKVATLQTRTQRHERAKNLGQAVEADVATMNALIRERDEARAELAIFKEQRDAARIRIAELDGALAYARGQRDAAERGREAMRVAIQQAEAKLSEKFYDGVDLIAKVGQAQIILRAALASPAGEGKAPIPPVQCKTCWDQRRVYAPPEGINGHARFVPCPDCAEGEGT